MVKTEYPASDRENRSIDIITLESDDYVPKHHHNGRDEIYVCLKGNGLVTIGENEYGFKQGTSVFVPKGETHSVKNLGVNKLVFHADNTPGAKPGDSTFV